MGTDSHAQRVLVSILRHLEGKQMLRETVEQMWQSFWDAVKEPGMPDIQRTEMRRAFFAGCWGMLQKCKGLGDPSISEDEGADYLEALEKEMQGFYRDLRTGRA